ncbi:hypothetical protein KSP39_PZI020245 [Platanthera zijinensis]|uniref:BED-type domain-containing protein n=1 Tax=Platanthera zijinensis TaxID=2320716 RepID=A0AAP0FWZ0_9ASPA
MSSEASTKESSTKLGRDPFWSHGEKVDAKDTNRVRCRYCSQVLSGGVSRLKAHLAGIRGNVKPCPKVPAEVKIQADVALKSQLVLKEAKKSIDDEDDEVFPGEGLTWQQVAECMDVDTEPRKSSHESRQSSMTPNTKSSKKKGKRKVDCVDEEEEVEFSASSEGDLIQEEILEGDYETDNDEINQTMHSEGIEDD